MTRADVSDISNFDPKVFDRVSVFHKFYETSQAIPTCFRFF